MTVLDFNETAVAVLEWVQQLVPALEGAYDYAPAAKPQALPDVVVDVTEPQTTVDDPRFPYHQLQGQWVLVTPCQVSLMAAATDPDGQPQHQLATRQLRGWGYTLLMGVRDDQTLGGRVDVVSPFVEVRFRPAFVEYGDGTRGREATVDLAVGQLIEEE